ncbi:MAG: ABC transporter permease [Acidobacteria bacterium]|nr:ABC transporter permease [Acidobacteriota bacterium]
MEFHLQMQIDDNLRLGMTPAEARRAALVKSGGVESAREACRDRRGLPAIEIAVRDLRHALRLLARSPAFAVVAVLSLALGIGANTAIFTLLDQIVLRSLPVRNPDQLQMIWTTGPSLGSNQGSRAASYPMYQDFQQRAAAFSYVFCRYLTPVSISLGSRTDRVTGELVSGNYFQALGVGAALGRVFTPEEDDRAYKGHPVVVLSYPYWVARFDADPAVLGRKILVNGYPMVVVGVSAAGFTGLDPARSPQVRIPVQMKPLMTPASDNLGDRRRQWLQIFARRKPGYTLEAASASLQPLLSVILRAELDSPALRDVSQRDRDRFLARRVLSESAVSGYSSLPSSYSRALVALMAMVGLVLLLACSNVAALLVARSAARQKELAMRLAIGASRGRLLRQLLMESAVLSTAGATVGLFLSVAMVRALLGFLPANGMLATLRAVPDWRILAFNAALALATALLFGLAPAWHALKTDLWDTLQQAAGAVGGSRPSVTLRRSLVTAQVAFSFLLVTGALLFGRTLLNLKNAPSGFHDIGTVITFQIDPARSGYPLPRLKAFCQQALQSIRSLPDVKSAGYAWVPVLSGREADWDIVVEGRAREDRDTQAWVNGISPGYWRTMGVPLLGGRDFDDGDVAGRPKAAIVNRAFARHFFGDRSPIGLRITLDTGRGAQPDTEIVGLVADSLYEGPRQGMRRQVFFPFPQMNQSVGTAFYVRTAGDPAGVFASLRRKIQELDSAMPVFEMKSLEDQLDETLGTERLSATLSVAFGALATLLAAVGLYGVMALTVARRAREIGLRMALGARQGALLWMVMREAFGILGLGLAMGFPCAYVLSRYLSSQLFGVEPADPATAVAAAIGLVAITATAALVPARRASRIDPIQALHHE